MTQIVHDARPTKSGEVLQMELDNGYSRSVGSVTITDAIEVGAVLRDNAGTWEQVVQADVATIGSDTLAVLIDDGVYSLKAVQALPADLDVGVLDDTSIVGHQKLSYGDVLSPAEKASVEARLEALNIKVTAQV
jgi:hypothetical protein